MRGERRRQPRPEPLQRRSVDTIEELVDWTLIALALLIAVLAATVAARRYGEWMHRAEIETRERTQVQAVLLEPTPQVFAVDSHGRAGRQLPAPVPVRYTAPDGTQQRAQADVTGPRPAGVTVPMWLDRSGELTGAPTSRLDAVWHAAAGGLGVLAIGAAVLVCSEAAFRSELQRITMARWEREWARVEPRWSGRAPS
ncbi:MAG: hypothetical protein JNM77_03390 [Pseudonocardia sp.]|nr:hypothetical protein [Pseudonocardia sp.]